MRNSTAVTVSTLSAQIFIPFSNERNREMAGSRTRAGNKQDEPGISVVPLRKEVLKKIPHSDGNVSKGILEPNERALNGQS